MKEVIALFIFCIVLFLYLHIYFHLKTSNDLEIYEMEQSSKEKLEETCDLRQPVLFEFNNDRMLENCNYNNIVKNCGAFDIKIRNIKEYDDETELYVPLTLNTAVEIFKNDNDAKFASERNGGFLDETGLIKNYRYNDSFLRPSMVSKCIYDLIMASNNSELPLRYEINYRNYYMVTQGKIKIRLIPPKSSKYLYPIKDYDNFEFISPVNVWDVQNQYKADFDRIKFVDIILTKGKIINIPAYWWYSIKILKPFTSICVFKYRTYMSTLSISNHLFIRMLQRQNIKREVNKTIIIKSNENNDDINSNSSNNKQGNIIKNEKEPIANDSQSSLYKYPVDLQLHYDTKDPLPEQFHKVTDTAVSATALALANQ